MLDETRIIHATGHFMETIIEPLVAAVARIEDMGAGSVIRRARLDEGASGV
jgi:hypothetical protein